MLACILSIIEFLLSGFDDLSRPTIQISSVTCKECAYEFVNMIPEATRLTTAGLQLDVAVRGHLCFLNSAHCHCTFGCGTV